MDTSVANPVTGYRSDRAYSTSEDDSDDEDKCWKRQATDKAMAMVTSSGYDFAKSSAVAGDPPLRGKRKVNNVWGAIASEELLTADLDQVSVIPTRDRECESYDYTRKELDSRPKPAELEMPIDDDELVTTHDVVDIMGPGPRGAKRSLADRLGERACTRPSRSRIPKGRGGPHSRRNKSGSSKSGSGSSERKEDDRVAKVVAELARRLQEPKVELLERCVTVLGIPQCLKLLGMVEDIEANGGLMTLDKSRRRTPGGVFFYILRAQAPRRQAHLIFAEEMQERERIRQIRQRARKERSRKTREKHVALAAAAVPLDSSPTPLDGGDEPSLDYSPTRLDYSPTRLDYSPTPLDGGSEPMADQEPGPSLTVAEPMAAADEAAEDDSDSDCQIVYIGPNDDEEEDGEVLD